ncbi:MAG: 4'-phosphopantetheinyl transferase superfamily protein [Deltaproteobacteria bacterium]|nr:4'-phosphopantetheinyl transferase superfamily protein [Deltaproteobacteria bacterium]
MFESLVDAAAIQVFESQIHPALPLVSTFEDENAIVQKAVDKRKREFILGRQLARTALKELGVAPGAILSAKDRTPRWPSGVIGSISHCNSWCAAAVGLAQDVDFLGIDIEEYSARTMSDSMIQSVCVSDELEWLSRLPAHDYHRGAMAVFSAKEAWYKAMYPITGQFLGFHGAQIKFVEFQADFAVWTGRLLESWQPFLRGAEFSCGKSRFSAEYVASAFIKYT